MHLLHQGKKRLATKSLLVGAHKLDSCLNFKKDEALKVISGQAIDLLGPEEEHNFGIFCKGHKQLKCLSVIKSIISTGV